MQLTTDQRLYIGGLLQWGIDLRQRFAKTTLDIRFEVTDSLAFEVRVYTYEGCFHRLTDNGTCGQSIFDRKGDPSELLRKSLSDIENYVENYHANQEAELAKQVSSLNERIEQLRKDRKAVQPAEVEL